MSERQVNSLRGRKQTSIVLQRIAIRFVFLIIPIAVGESLKAYAHFTDFQAFAVVAVLFVAGLALLKLQSPSERSEPL
jgi:hypothetical protein